jgi:serine/threonine protein kinase
MKGLILSELDTLANVSHINIVDVKETLHDDTNYYIASEIIEGGELTSRLLAIDHYSE